jgi:acylpyruvate hydrolase
LRFISYEMDGRQGIAVNDGDRFRGLTCDKTRYPGDLSTLVMSSENLSDVGGHLLKEPIVDVRAVTLLPPVARPPKILCVGLNYDDHLNEVGLKRPDYPEIFARFATSLIGHGAAIARPPESDKLDYEAELAVVIGLGGRRIAKDAALNHIAGYSIFNDATLRDYQIRTPQWTVGKNFDRTGAFGPWLVTPDALPLGAKGLRIQGRLNGQTMQDSNTSFLIFDVATLIAMLSTTMTLEPGDVIITGTPGGVGVSRNPKLFMQPGDVFEAEIEHIGTLSNAVADEG